MPASAIWCECEASSLVVSSLLNRIRSQLVSETRAGPFGSRTGM
jgi:hypothetical protein